MKALLIVFLIPIFSCSSKLRPVINYLNQQQPDTIPEIFGPGLISVQGRFDLGFTMSPDGKSMAFGVANEHDPKENYIYMLNFSNGKWSDPDKGILPDNDNTFFPMFGPKGNEFYFAKSINTQETDIWWGKYRKNKLYHIQPLRAPVNSTSREAGHGKSLKGSFYFTSNRDDKQQCCGDVFSSEVDNNGNYSSVHTVMELNSAGDEESLFLARDESFIILQSWKNEFNSKHDLYLSYRTKEGNWTPPERLSTTINSKEIEQRPFVSPDNHYLFFSRLSKRIENGKEILESDIFWVSTKSLFKPYPYNLTIKNKVTYKKPFRIILPKDLFKDVDDTKLIYQAALENGRLPDWIKFNESKLILYGIWELPVGLIIIITAMDKYGNTSLVKIPITETLSKQVQ